MLTRKEAVLQMIDSRDKALTKDIPDLLDKINDKIQISVNKGLGKVDVNLQGEDIESIKSLIRYLEDKGFYVKFYTERFGGLPKGLKIPYITIQWDLPWWRRLF